MKVTIVDIARKLNITPSTVSRALANNERVNIKTRELVKKTAREMGYQPNILASSLRKGTSDTIGMVVPRINRHFFSNVICGVEEVLNAAGYNLTILQSSEKYDSEVKAIDTLLKSRVAGVIISHSLETRNFDHLQSISKQLPIVQFDRVNASVTGPKIVNDNYTGAFEAGAYLLKKGYKKFVHLTGNDSTAIYKERKQGFIDALVQAGVKEADIQIIESALTREAGNAAIKDLLKQDKFDAVFCAGDYAALGVIEALKEANINIPETGVIGFANEPFAELMCPSMSTVNQNGAKMGRITAKAMLKVIKNKELNGTEVVSVNLIKRQSTL